METKYAVRGEVVIVEFTGRLDFETTAPFKRTCTERLLSEKVVFDLKNLNFVGSLGLTDFVSTLNDIARESGPGVRFCGVSSEFRRLFESTGLASQSIFENQEKAVQSFARSI